MQLLEWELAGSTLQTVLGLIRGSEDRVPAATHGGSSAVLGGSGGAAFGGGQQLPALASRLTEKGVLQLMFDVRTLRDVLACGRPLSASSSSAAAATSAPRAPLHDGSASLGAGEGQQDPRAAAAMAERRKEWLRLEQQLQVRFVVDSVCAVWRLAHCLVSG
jgi:hypothetical protein